MSNASPNPGLLPVGVSTLPGEIAGFDKTAVEQWLAQNVPSLDQTLSWERLEGGHSNLTYALTGEDGTRAVIRRPPEGELLPKAHDMAREWRVLEALSSTNVPVARPLAFCDDKSVAGANFYVMGFVQGRPFYEADELREWIPIDRRPAMAANMVGALVALHAVDPASVGLERHGRPDGYIERQLRSWYGSWNASIEAADIDAAYVHEMHDRLAADLPEQGPASIVHGDYMVHNVMFDQEGSVTAIVDWEISTLGDPLADLAYLLNGWVAADDVPPPQETAPTLAERTTTPGGPGGPIRRSQRTKSRSTWLLLGLQLLQDGLHPSRRLRPLPQWPEGD